MDLPLLFVLCYAVFLLVTTASIPTTFPFSFTITWPTVSFDFITALLIDYFEDVLAERLGPLRRLCYIPTGTLSAPPPVGVVAHSSQWFHLMLSVCAPHFGSVPVPQMGFLTVVKLVSEHYYERVSASIDWDVVMRIFGVALVVFGVYRQIATIGLVRHLQRARNLLVNISQLGAASPLLGLVLLEAIVSQFRVIELITSHPAWYQVPQLLDAIRTGLVQHLHIDILGRRIDSSISSFIILATVGHLSDLCTGCLYLLGCASSMLCTSAAAVTELIARSEPAIINVLSIALVSACVVFFPAILYNLSRVVRSRSFIVPPRRLRRLARRLSHHPVVVDYLAVDLIDCRLPSLLDFTACGTSIRLIRISPSRLVFASHQPIGHGNPKDINSAFLSTLFVPWASSIVLSTWKHSHGTIYIITILIASEGLSGVPVAEHSRLIRGLTKVSGLMADHRREAASGHSTSLQHDTQVSDTAKRDVRALITTQCHGSRLRFLVFSSCLGFIDALDYDDARSIHPSPFTYIARMERMPIGSRVVDFLTLTITDSGDQQYIHSRVSEIQDDAYLNSVWAFKEIDQRVTPIGLLTWPSELWREPVYPEVTEVITIAPPNDTVSNEAELEVISDTSIVDVEALFLTIPSIPSEEFSTISGPSTPSSSIYTQATFDWFTETEEEVADTESLPSIPDDWQDSEPVMEAEAKDSFKEERNEINDVEEPETIRTLATEASSGAKEKAKEADMSWTCVGMPNSPVIPNPVPTIRQNRLFEGLFRRKKDQSPSDVSQPTAGPSASLRSTTRQPTESPNRSNTWKATKRPNRSTPTSAGAFPSPLEARSTVPATGSTKPKSDSHASFKNNSKRDKRMKHREAIINQQAAA